MVRTEHAGAQLVVARGRAATHERYEFEDVFDRAYQAEGDPRVTEVVDV